MHDINWGLLSFHSVLIFYNNVQKLLGCFPAGFLPLALCQRMQTVTVISSTATRSSFISILSRFSSRLTSFLTPLVSTSSFDLSSAAAGNKSPLQIISSTSFILTGGKDGWRAVQMSAAFSAIKDAAFTWNKCNHLTHAGHVGDPVPGEYMTPECGNDSRFL